MFILIPQGFPSLKNAGYLGTNCMNIVGKGGNGGDLVFATSGKARGLEPYEPTNSTSRAGSSQHKLELKLWSSEHFIPNLAKGRVEGNGTGKEEVMGGAGERGRWRESVCTHLEA